MGNYLQEKLPGNDTFFWYHKELSFEVSNEGKSATNLFLCKVRFYNTYLFN